MENINRIEIQGIVVSRRIADSQGTKIITCSVATNHIYDGSNGTLISETTWHNVSYFKKADDGLDIDMIEKGVNVHIIGRIRNIRYIDTKGIERYSTQVIASEFKIVNAC